MKLDKLTKKYTAFENFDDLVNAKGGYFPSLCGFYGYLDCTRGDITELANAYDDFQQKRGDSRRVFRT